MSEKGTDTYSFVENDEREVEEFVGIKAYATEKMESIGGEYKKIFKDFIVKEVLNNGKILDINEDNQAPLFSKELKDKYTTFNLVKINRDTFNAIREISKKLNIPNNLISYSGLKDKFSISVQRISIKGDFIEKLRKLNIKDIFIRNIHPSRKPLKLGSHWGNHFTIVLRNIDYSKNLKDRIEIYIKILNDFGFPNYFGLQRFGNYRPNSHIVGRCLLNGDFKQAFEEFVSTTYSTESLESKRARGEFQNTRNLRGALKNFPKSLKYEKNMIHHLIENSEDYEGSVNTLPSNLKKLLISSFQSYLFNKMISLRVEKGIPLFKPINGDVIGILDDYNGNITQVTYLYGSHYDKYLQKALDLNRAAIVIPIIGADTDLNVFPLMKSLYDEIAQQENIDQTIFNRRLIDELEFKGSIRAMMVKPIGLKLIDFADDDLNPEKKKIKLEFSLQKGSYATMLIRELNK